MDGRPCLAVEGDQGQLPVWQDRFRALGGAEVRTVARMPLDRRHGSKIDLPALKRLLAS